MEDQENHCLFILSFNFCISLFLYGGLGGDGFERVAYGLGLGVSVTGIDSDSSVGGLLGEAGCPVLPLFIKYIIYTLFKFPTYIFSQ